MNSKSKNWKKKRLGDLFEIKSGGTPSTKVSKYWNGTIPWITSASISGVRNIQIERYVSEEGIKNSSTNLVPKDSILVVTRVGLGKVAIAPTDICFSQDIQALLPNKEVYSEYILYFLSDIAKFFKQKSRGTTISGITKKQLTDLQILLPPLDKQKQIVNKIEELFSIVDNANEQIVNILGMNNNQVSKISMLKQSILKQAFEGKLV